MGEDAQGAEAAGSAPGGGGSSSLPLEALLQGEKGLAQALSLALTRLYHTGPPRPSDAMDQLVQTLGEDWRLIKSHSKPQHRGKDAFLRLLESMGLGKALHRALVELEKERRAREVGPEEATRFVKQWLGDRRRRQREKISGAARLPPPAREAKAAVKGPGPASAPGAAAEAEATGETSPRTTARRLLAEGPPVEAAVGGGRTGAAAGGSRRRGAGRDARSRR